MFVHIDKELFPQDCGDEDDPVFPLVPDFDHAASDMLCPEEFQFTYADACGAHGLHDHAQLFFPLAVGGAHQQLKLFFCQLFFIVMDICLLCSYTFYSQPAHADKHKELVQGCQHGIGAVHRVVDHEPFFVLQQFFLPDLPVF